MARTRRLERLPARPDEGLVVEARGHEGGEPVDQRGAIVRRGRRGIDRAHGKIVVERFGRGAEIRRRAAGAGHVDDRVRLLGPGAPDAARPVIFEAAADDADAAGEQRRGDAVALEPDERLAVEGEGERLAAIDRAALGETESGHGAAPQGFAADDRVGRRVARHGEGFHAGPMQPDFAGFALRVGVEIEVVGPGGVADRLGRLGPGLRLADIVELGLVARTAERAGEDLHGEASKQRFLGGPTDQVGPIHRQRHEVTQRHTKGLVVLRALRALCGELSVEPRLHWTIRIMRCRGAELRSTGTGLFAAIIHVGAQDGVDLRLPASSLPPISLDDIGVEAQRLIDLRARLRGRPRR